MSEDYQIVYKDEPAWSIIGGGISAFNKEKAGEDNARNFCFVLEGTNEEVLGGVIGATYWEWGYINLMWIQDDYRGQGYGARLLAKAEDLARERGAQYVYLDTFSFQAPDFYKKYGYEVFGELDNFPAGHQRYFLWKTL